MSSVEASDTKAVAALLNVDLVGEHDAIVYYLTHAWTVARQYGPQILEIANDEMRHFKWLSHTIAQLGGEPDLTIPPVTMFKDLAAAMQKDVDAEIRAIDQYRDHAERITNPQVSTLLRRIIVDERDHLRQFQELLQESHGQPLWDQEPAEQVAPVANKLRNSMRIEYQQMLKYLWQSFMHDHQKTMGMDAEERAVDEMRHMGWIGKRLGQMGYDPTLTSDPPGDVRVGEHDEMHAFTEIRIWAHDHMPQLVPTLDRILAHESYHLEMQATPGSSSP